MRNAYAYQIDFLRVRFLMFPANIFCHVNMGCNSFHQVLLEPAGYVTSKLLGINTYGHTKSIIAGWYTIYIYYRLWLRGFLLDLARKLSTTASLQQRFLTRRRSSTCSLNFMWTGKSFMAFF
jgi:hypothetical protein